MEKRETKRLFIDVELPPAIKKEIACLIKSFPLAKDQDIRFVDPKNIHLTLIFLGNILSSRTAEIKKLVSGLEIENFDISLGDISFFYPRNPGIIYIKIEKGKKELGLLRDKILKELLELGISIEADEKPFKPHITLARIKSRPDKTAMPDLINILKCSGFTDKKPRAEFGCVGISLKKSITGSSPPVHKKLCVKRKNSCI